MGDQIKVKIQLPQRWKKLEIIKSTLKNAEENLKVLKEFEDAV